MTILTMHKEGAPILRAKAREIVVFDDALVRLARDMRETMHAANSWSISAPQVGTSVRLVVIEHNGALLTMCNPRITSANGETLLLEGCSSCDIEPVRLLRRREVFVDYQDLDGVPRRTHAYTERAVAIQHEIEHLDGILFTDHVRAEHT